MNAEIRNWILIDDQIKKLNEEIKNLRDERNKIETNVTNYAKNNNMTNTIVKINNERLKFVDTKIPEPLTFRYLEKTLGEIIKNESQVKLIMEHIKQKRVMKVIPEIKRLSNN